jgi:UDP-2-acetamido-2,6-beta-L-arabino-hexul-4-ose reductase
MNLSPVTGIHRATARRCRSTGRRTPVVFSHRRRQRWKTPTVEANEPRKDILLNYGHESGAPVFVFRLTNVFGKWSRPDYNSVIATFCHKWLAVFPSVSTIRPSGSGLIYIDDVVDAFLRCLTSPGTTAALEVGPVYEATVGEVANIIGSFFASRSTLLSPPVGVGLVRALYATYVTHLPVASFAYRVPHYDDPRGTFAEVLKTPDCGQFSYSPHIQASPAESIIITPRPKNSWLFAAPRDFASGRSRPANLMKSWCVAARVRRRNHSGLGARHHKYRRRRIDRDAVGKRGF